MSLRDRQRTQVRDLVLDTVVDLLEHADIADLTVPDAAQAAGVSVRTVYRYFPTREQLLAEAGERIRDRIGLPVAELRDPEEIPDSFWDASAKMAAHPRLARALAHTTTGRAAHAGNRAQRTATIERAITAMSPPLPAAKAAQVSAVVTHLCSSAAWIAVSDNSELDDDQARAAVHWALTTLIDAARAEAAAATNSVHSNSDSTVERNQP